MSEVVTETAPAVDDDLSSLLDGVVSSEEKPPFDVPETQAASATPTASATKPKKEPRGRVALYFDLETVPDYDRVPLFGLDPLPSLRAETPINQCPQLSACISLTVEASVKLLTELRPPESWLAEFEAAEKAKDAAGGKEKTRKGVLDAIAKVRGENDVVKQAFEDRRKLLSVTPEFCKIVAMGCARGTGEVRAFVAGQPIAGVGTDAVSEIDILESFWVAADESAPLCGYNVLGFDLPVIFVRSAILGVKPSRKIDLTPWKGEVVDLMQARYPKGGAKPMKDLARFYGLQVPAGDCEGSQVENLFHNDPAKLAEYVKSDVAVARQLHQFFKGAFC